jgi:hypothetical protein
MVTKTVHGRCARCWHVKRPDLVPRASEDRRGSWRDWITDAILGLVWFIPGIAIIVAAVLIGGEEVLLVVGLLLVVSGGAIRFGDFVGW